MKIKFILLCLLGISLFVKPAFAKEHILYVGTYNKDLADGIFVYSFNDHTGKLVDLKIPAVSKNPSFLTISANKKYLYAVNELNNLDIDQSGGVSSFNIDKNGKLSLINQVLTHGANPCHVSLSPNGEKLVASNYSGGSISLFNVLPTGGLSELIQKIQDVGKGPFPGRQNEPHAHSTKFDATGKLLVAADLGLDELKSYQVVVGEKPLIPNTQPFIKFPPGSGPRHFEFSSDGNFLYVINELSSTITILIKYGGVWKEIQSIKTLPKDFKGENWCADIHLSANGHFIYASNRGHNSIVVYTRNPTSGRLEIIQTCSSIGIWPRNFTLDPTGKFLLVANERSNEITVFKIDGTSGKLTYTGFKVNNQAPVCLQFLK